MPLPRDEQRILQQIERGLAADDPRFASHLTVRSGRPHRTWLLRTRRGVHRHLTAAVLLLGAGLLLAGVATGWLWLVAFGAVALMLGCARAV